MTITRTAGWTLAGVLAGCGGAPAEVKKDEVKPVAAKPEAAKPEAAKPEAAKPSESKPESAKPDLPKPDEAEPVEPAVGGAWGVAACDSYMKAVSDCKAFKQDSPVFKALTDKWRRLKDEGKTDELEKNCVKAAELFRCPTK